VKPVTRHLKFAAASAFGVAFAVVVRSAQAQQFPIPTTAAQVPGPAPGTAMTKAYVQSVGRMAYLWGWPLVNVANRANAFSKAPEPGLLGGVVPVAFGRNAMMTGYISPEEHFVTCPNQDVVAARGESSPSHSPSSEARQVGVSFTSAAHRQSGSTFNRR
jgi:hypothetical protein